MTAGFLAFLCELTILFLFQHGISINGNSIEYMKFMYKEAKRKYTG